MGAALYGTGRGYARLLRLVLGRGVFDGRRLLGAEAADLMTSNLIGDLKVPPLRSTLPHVSADVDLFPGARLTWTAAFQRVEQDVPGRRRAGSVGWAGIGNTHCWVDPATGIAAVFLTQLLPFCDPRCLDAVTTFEQAVYRCMGPAVSGARPPSGPATTRRRPPGPGR